MSSSSLQINHLSMCGHRQGLWPGTMHTISEIIALHTLVSPDPKQVALEEVPISWTSSPLPI